MIGRRLVGVAAAAMLVVAACGSSGDTDSSKYSIGYDSSQTGGLAYSDVSASKGVQLAIKEINAKGGIAGKWPIELTLQDNRSEAAQSAVVAQDLISKGVQFLICTSDADPCTAAGQIAKKTGIPTMSTAATSPTLPASVGDNMFMSVFGDNTQATALADYATDAGYKSVYLLCSPDSSYTSKSCDYFGQVFENKGGTVAGRGSFTLGAADFSAEVTKIQNMSPAPDVIMTPAYPPDAPTFIKQLRAAGVEIPVISIDGVDSVDTISAGGPAVEGLVFTTHGFPVEGTPMADFWDAYTAEYGSAPDSVFAATGYDLIKVVEAGVIAADSTDPAKVRDAIDNLEGVQGATGTVTYKGQNRIPIKTVYLVTVKDGKFELLKTLEPASADIPAP
ncbi:MAG: ABC transporter substrate-binding protein [Chloroflexi bacterium]|nr:ABC transporter substrate-binding protein [Chloroflexota bacterium]